MHDLLTRAEDQWFERKAFRIQPKDLAKTIVAFANAEGGKIAVGISDKKFEGYPTPKQENSIRQVSLEHTDPTVRVSFSKDEGEDGQVILIDVKPSNTVHYLTNGDCYLRVGDQSHKLSTDEIMELRYSKGEQRYDARAVHNASIRDLDPAAYEAYAKEIGSSSPLDALRARYLIDSEDNPTTAAILLFGKEPQRWFPNAQVRILQWEESHRIPGRQQRLLYDKRVEGTIPHQIITARELILDRLPKVSRLGKEGLFANETSIPQDAWLEGLVNAVIHRSYSLSGDHIRFEIFPDRIEITSPGRFPGLANPRNPEQISRFARNPHIARAAQELHIGQELGEGIRRIFSEMRSVGFTDPIYRQTSGTVILELHTEQRLSYHALKELPELAESVLSLLQRTNRPLGTGEIAKELQTSSPTVRRTLQAMQDRDLVVWRGNSPRDPRATWQVRDAL